MYTDTMQNSTNSYDEEVQLAQHLKYLNVRTMS